MKTGLKAKIIRVGNLMGRYSDGKFQINIHENSFLGRFRAYVAIGCFPMSRAGEMVEFSPIDSVAKAVIH